MQHSSVQEDFDSVPAKNTRNKRASASEGNMADSLGAEKLDYHQIGNNASAEDTSLTTDPKKKHRNKSVKKMKDQEKDRGNERKQDQDNDRDKDIKNKSRSVMDFFTSTPKSNKVANNASISPPDPLLKMQTSVHTLEKMYAKDWAETTDHAESDSITSTITLPSLTTSTIVESTACHDPITTMLTCLSDSGVAMTTSYINGKTTNCSAFDVQGIDQEVRMPNQAVIGNYNVPNLQRDKFDE